jgi:nucleoid DNA-binding protein/nucleoid-associated protein YgaU
MNEKKNIQDLCAIISEASGVSKKNSEAFLRTLFDLVEEALEKDGIAKVPGLGTFKTTTVEERKSVNVRTGEEIIIPSYKKVNFTPSKELKEKVNQPFSHLVPFYTLKKEGPVDPPEEEDDIEIVEEDRSLEDLPQGEESLQADSSQGMLNDQQSSLSPTEENESSDFTEKTTFNNTTEMEDIKRDSNEMEEQNINETQENLQDSEINQSEIQDSEIGDEDSTQEDPIITEEVSANEDEDPQISETQEPEVTSEEDETDDRKEDAKESSEEKPEPEEKVVEEEKKSSKKWLLWIFILLILALAALFATKYFMEKNAEEKSAEGETFTEETSAIQNDTLPTSTTAEDTYFKEDTFATTDDLNVEEQVEEPIDCYTEPEKCTTEIDGSEQKEVKNGHSFDPKLVEFMQKNYPELNFPSFVPVKETYTVKDGSRLAQISRNIYNNEYIFWGYIYAFNTDQLNSPNDIKTGMVLKVPDLDSDFIDPYSAKCKKIAAEVNKFLQ